MAGRGCASYLFYSDALIHARSLTTHSTGRAMSLLFIAKLGLIRRLVRTG